MRYLDLRRASLLYAARADAFIYNHGLPKSWFDEGYDHVAVKSFSVDDYRNLITELQPMSDFVTETRMDDRFIATMRLISNYAINMSISGTDLPSIAVRDVEVMLARPEARSSDPPKFDHAEVYLPRGLIPVRRVLGNKGIYFDDEGNEAHTWISLRINRDGDELKFTEDRLDDIIKKGIKCRRTQVLYQDPFYE